MPAPRILMVLTASDRATSLDAPTGLWLDAFAAPYYAFIDQDLDVLVATADDRPAVIDPRSLAEDALTPAARRYGDDSAAHGALAEAVAVTEVDARDFDAVFVCGTGDEGPHAATLTRLLRDFADARKPIAALGGATAALVDIAADDGRPWIAGRRVTAPTDHEERFLANGSGTRVNSAGRLRVSGAEVVGGGDFQAFAVTDGALVTGQNAQSALHAAEALLTALDDL